MYMSSTIFHSVLKALLSQAVTWRFAIEYPGRLEGSDIIFLCLSPDVKLVFINFCVQMLPICSM